MSGRKQFHSGPALGGSALHQQGHQVEHGGHGGGPSRVEAADRHVSEGGLGVLHGGAGVLERRSTPGPGAGGQGLFHGADPDPDAPVRTPDEVQHDRHHRCRVAQDGLHLVARGALGGADHGGGGKVGEQVGDPVGIPAAASLVDRQYKHGDLPASTV